MITALALACAEPPDVPDAPASPRTWTRASFDAMSTRIDVTVPAGDPGAVDAVEDAFRAVEHTANEWRDGSPLAAVNAGAGCEVDAPADLRALVARSVALAEATGGAFDPTWAALWGTWDFRGEPRLPDPDIVAERVRHVGWRQVRVDEAAGTIALADPHGKLGLGGIAKGWALDRAGEALRARGATDFLLSAGGQVLAHGTKDGRAWQVGVRDPRGARDDFFAVIEVGDASVSTSGDYERFFEIDGVRYHHILDPRTGWPARGVRSATVVAGDATTADALSTALVVAGPTEGLAIAERFGVQAAIVDDQGMVHATPRLALVAVHDPIR